MKRIGVDDFEMSVVDRGSGLPVVLLHGFPLDHQMWSLQIEALAGRCRVIAPDLRGYGGSSLGEVDPVHGVSMERYADDLARMLDALGEERPVVLCGFSMGGYIAWAFLRKHRPRVRALVLCDTRAQGDTSEARANRLKMADHVEEWGSSKVAEMMAPKLFAQRTIDERPDVVRRVVDVISATDPRAIAAAQRGMASRPDSTALLKSVGVPTLVLGGEEDTLSPEAEMAAMAEQIPGARFLTVPAAGHLAPVEQPEEVARALTGFLGTLF